MTQHSRKARELALRQQIIFEAAEGVLAERGFHGASVDEIAKRAELSVGTLYNLFDSKDHLYAALLERGIEDVRGAVRARVSAATTGIDKLHAAIDAIFAHFAEHERAFRVYVTATHGMEWNLLPQFGERAFGQMRAFGDDIAGLCRLALREGALPELDPHILALSLTGTINAFVTRWVTERRGTLDSYRQAAHRILEALQRNRARATGRAVQPAQRRAGGRGR